MRFLNEIMVTYPNTSSLKQSADSLAFTLRNSLVAFSEDELRDQSVATLTANLTKLAPEGSQTVLSSIELGKRVPDAYDRIGPLLFEIRLISPPDISDAAGQVFSDTIKGLCFDLLGESGDHVSLFEGSMLRFINSVRKYGGNTPLQRLGSAPAASALSPTS